LHSPEGTYRLYVNSGEFQLQIDLKKYSDFVNAITSETSNNAEALIARIKALQTESPSLNVSLALTSATGMCGESGEFSEIFKKIVYHGKPYNEETKAHAAKELGDVIWYWTNACRALGLDPNQVIADNVTKLEARYPGGKFSAAASELRAAGDI
jgi:NTP pyrophosphatase (non-canonical NTP hydrolase)